MRLNGRATQDYFAPMTAVEILKDGVCAYASAGVKEVWLVLGPEKQIEVHRQPQGGQYAESAVHGPRGRVTSTAVPGFTVDVASLFAA